MQTDFRDQRSAMSGRRASRIQDSDPRSPVSPPSPRRAGQALIEACLVVALTALVLFGVLQVVLLYAAAEVVTRSAASGARAGAVGLNDFMVAKCVRVAAIPNAGALLTPEAGASPVGGLWRTARPGTLWEYAVASAPSSPRLEAELSRIPLYLGADWAGQLPAILDYADWDTVGGPGLSAPDPISLRSETRQDYPLRFPFHRVFYLGDSVPLRGEVTLEDHAALYLE